MDFSFTSQVEPWNNGNSDQATSQPQPIRGKMYQFTGLPKSSKHDSPAAPSDKDERSAHNTPTLDYRVTRGPWSVPKIVKVFATTPLSRQNTTREHFPDNASYKRRRLRNAGDEQIFDYEIHNRILSAAYSISPPPIRLRRLTVPTLKVVAAAQGPDITGSANDVPPIPVLGTPVASLTSARGTPSSASGSSQSRQFLNDPSILSSDAKGTPSATTKLISPTISQEIHMMISEEIDMGEAANQNTVGFDNTHSGQGERVQNRTSTNRDVESTDVEIDTMDGVHDNNTMDTDADDFVPIKGPSTTITSSSRPAHENPAPSLREAILKQCRDQDRSVPRSKLQQRGLQARASSRTVPNLKRAVTDSEEEQDIPAEKRPRRTTPSAPTHLQTPANVPSLVNQGVANTVPALPASNSAFVPGTRQALSVLSTPAASGVVTSSLQIPDQQPSVPTGGAAPVSTPQDNPPAQQPALVTSDMPPNTARKPTKAEERKQQQPRKTPAVHRRLQRTTIKQPSSGVGKVRSMKRGKPQHQHGAPPPFMTGNKAQLLAMAMKNENSSKAKSRMETARALAALQAAKATSNEDHVSDGDSDEPPSNNAPPASQTSAQPPTSSGNNDLDDLTQGMEKLTTVQVGEQKISNFKAELKNVTSNARYTSEEDLDVDRRLHDLYRRDKLAELDTEHLTRLKTRWRWYRMPFCAEPDFRDLLLKAGMAKAWGDELPASQRELPGFEMWWWNLESMVETFLEEHPYNEWKPSFLGDNPGSAFVRKHRRYLDEIYQDREDESLNDESLGDESLDDEYLDDDDLAALHKRLMAAAVLGELDDFTFKNCAESFEYQMLVASGHIVPASTISSASDNASAPVPAIGASPQQAPAAQITANAAQQPASAPISQASASQPNVNDPTPPVTRNNAVDELNKMFGGCTFEDCAKASLPQS